METMKPSSFTWAQRAWMFGAHDGLTDLRWRHMCEVHFPLRLRLDGKQVRTAFHHVVRRYPMLRMRIALSAEGAMEQSVMPQQSADELMFVEIDRESANSAFFDQVNQRIRGGYPLNIAVVLIQDPEFSTLVIKASHLFLDGEGASIILADILDLLERPVVAPFQVEDRAHEEIAALEAGPKYQKMSVRNVDRLCALADQATRLGVTRDFTLQPNCSVGHSSSTALRRSSSTLATGLKIFESAVPLSLFLLAYRELVDCSHTWFSVCSANRLEAAERRYVGLQSRHGALFASIDRDTETFAALARRITQSLASAVQNARHDPREQIDQVRQRGYPDNPPLFFNFMGSEKPVSPLLRLPEEPALERERRIEWETAPSGRFALEINVYSAPGEVSVVCEHDPVLFSRQTVTSLINGLSDAGDFVIASGPDVTVGEIRAHLAHVSS